MCLLNCKNVNTSKQMWLHCRHNATTFWQLLTDRSPLQLLTLTLEAGLEIHFFSLCPPKVPNSVLYCPECKH